MSEYLENMADFERPGEPVFERKPITPIGIDIDLDTRLTFVDKEELATEWQMTHQIAELTETYPKLVIRMIKEMHIEPEVRLFRGQETPFYPPFTTAVIKEELAWRQNWRALPSHVLFTDIVEFIGRSAGWTRKTMDLIGARPTRSEIGNSGRVLDTYPKGVLKSLRRINMAVPMEDGWHPMYRVVDRNDVDWQWAERRIKAAGFAPERRRSALTGKILEHYPPAAMDYIRLAKTERPMPGGVWLTANTIAELAGRSYNWTSRRVKHHHDMSEERLDDQGVSRKHYPPQIAQAMIEESTLQAALPEIGDHLSLDRLRRVAGHTKQTTLDLLEEFGIQPEPRKDKLGRIQLCYEPNVPVRLNEFWETQQPSQADKLAAATIAVDGLRTRIKEARQHLQTTKACGELAVSSELLKIEDSIVQDKAELKKAQLRYYRLRG